MSHATEVNQDTFEELVLKNPLPVLVDFWAEWCGPCRMVGPVVEQIAAERQGHLAVFKLDVDSNTDLAVEYGIQSIPAILLFKNGKAVDKHVGAVPKASLEKFLDKNLNA